MLDTQRPLGFQRITDLSAAVGLTVPAGTMYALITCETQSVRFRDDGVDPTATIGFPLVTGTILQYSGAFSAIKFIQQTASASLNVSYYGG